MRASTIVMIGFAVIFGLLAVLIAQIWLNNQATMRAKNIDRTESCGITNRSCRETIATLRHRAQCGDAARGAVAVRRACQAAPLPRIHDIMSGGRRVVLAAIEANEPVLALKITGPGQRRRCRLSSSRE